MGTVSVPLGFSWWITVSGPSLACFPTPFSLRVSGPVPCRSIAKLFRGNMVNIVSSIVRVGVSESRARGQLYSLVALFPFVVSPAAICSGEW
ncbi:hypothetical protein JTE90_006722 [Oedothorax gibbosus]|uniref:Secreted protein n=1 Tax=Oedothorax gibbosus TaxID=931172 RepID=A0AAV6TG80_9ARAC|nr:hypothetical protein JTE90_006722 [Oedothorax gibbosus]